MLKSLFIFLLAFVLGMLATTMYADYTRGELSIPAGMQGTYDLPSPEDYISEEDILVYKDKVIIRLDSPQWASFSPTRSMDPVLDAGHNAIEIALKSMDQVQVGDIVSYYSKKADSTIIHRVIYKGTDDDGQYLIMKGDNNPSRDPEKVREDQLRRKVVGIIY